MAREIFDRYAGQPGPDQCPGNPLIYTHGHSGVLRSDRYRKMDSTKQWRPSAIAGPTFSDILWTEELYFWVRDTIDTNHALESSEGLLERHVLNLKASELSGPVCKDQA